MAADVPGGGEERRSQVETADTALPVALPLDEARNALRQYNLGMRFLDEWLTHPGPFRLRISHVLTLNRAAEKASCPTPARFASAAW